MSVEAVSETRPAVRARYELGDSSRVQVVYHKWPAAEPPRCGGVDEQAGGHRRANGVRSADVARPVLVAGLGIGSLAALDMTQTALTLTLVLVAMLATKWTLAPRLAGKCPSRRGTGRHRAAPGRCRPVVAGRWWTLEEQP